MAENNYHEEEVLGKAYDARLMRRLLTYVRPYKLPIVVAILVLVAGATLELLLLLRLRLHLFRFLFLVADLLL